MKILLKTSLAMSLLLGVPGFHSCKSQGDYKETLLLFTDDSPSFEPITEQPKLTIVVDKARGVYYKAIHFEKEWELAHDPYSLNNYTTISPGFHLADGEGLNGYDFKRTFKTINDAINAAQTRGGAYTFRLGTRYRLNGIDLYRTSDGHKLPKTDR